jgi:hypothetical protein
MPTLAYRITEWKSRYEVTYKGHEADDNTPTENLRRRYLEYIRCKVMGLNVGPAFQRLTRKANQYGPAQAPATFGVFIKLAEVAAKQTSTYRGWILDEKQNPLHPEEFAEILGWDKDVVKRAFEVLCEPKIGWIQQVEFGVFPENPEIPGISGNGSGPSGAIPECLYNENETKTKREDKSKNETKEEPSRKNREESVSPILPGEPVVSFRKQSRMVQDMSTIEAIEKIFLKRSDADDLVIRNIVRHVPADKHGLLIQNAQDSLQGRKPIAKFVDEVKRRFGYRGNGGP